ncbi:MAG: hypothetical protein C4576_33440 [Desulfobacteraceae bacterium]|nr:MAG: hypothetical protein C4576_33440 [Desulfobacteraceae bacterium]
MISSISGNRADHIPEGALSNKGVHRNNGEAFPDGVPRISPIPFKRFDPAGVSTAAALLNEPLLLPAARNVKELSAELSARLADIFSLSGIPSHPPVHFRVDEKTGRIKVESDSPAARQIEELVNADHDVKPLFETINAISTHTSEMPKHLKFQREYLASNNPEQVITKYSSMFGPRPDHRLSMIYSGGTIRMIVDGKEGGLPQESQTGRIG